MYFLSLEPKKIVTQFPGSMDVLKSWIKTKALGSVSAEPGINLEGYRKDLDAAISDEYLETILLYNPRNLYDFFDEQDIRIAITPGANGTFYASLYEEGTNIPHPNRWAAERAGLTIAFITLEDRIHGSGTETERDGHTS